MNCTYRGCDTPATHRIEAPANGGTWYGCPDHQAAMDAALSLHGAADLTATVTPLDGQERR